MSIYVNTDDDEIEYVVEQILDRKMKKGKYMYLVKWEGYNNDHNTWEPEKNLTNCKKILKQFSES